MVFGLFKKKKVEVKEIPSSNLNTNPMPEYRPEYREPRYPDFQSSNPELQLIISKLDLINARLQNIEQRLAYIEKVAKESQEQPIRKW